MEKQELKTICSQISDLIKETNNSNAYDNIITFFQLTSTLYDKLEEIQAIPIATQSPTWIQRLFNKKQAKQTDQIIQDLEREKRALCNSIKNSGRNGYNHTTSGEEVTKHNIYFGGIAGLPVQTVEEWEHSRDTPKNYNKIASQMTEFMKGFKESFMLTNWL